MSNIAMFTMGTRGDVQPYIFLSKELMKNGHEVTLGSHPCWKDLIILSKKCFRVFPIRIGTAGWRIIRLSSGGTANGRP